jgi:TolB-like protein/Flp pilus assembly protein TadD
VNRPVLALSVLIALGLGYFAADKLWFSKRTASERPVAAVAPAATPVAAAVSEKSVAVLPFVDMSEKKDQEYFADGMAEEIINLLAQVPELYIPARTSSFYFKGKSTRIPDIARELGVAHVLEGSVRKSGNRLRLTAQLIRADSGYHVWSQTYDRDFIDVFKVQDEVANAVVQALQISLMGGPLTRQRGGTQNLEAYQLYLRAGDSTNQNSMASLEESRVDLEQAIKLDPAFGLAWCSLAMHYAVAAENGLIPPQEGFERARRLAQQALQLSPDISEAHAILSYVKSSYDWDWPGAETEWRRALVLDPTNTHAIAFSGALYMTLGRWADADRQLRLALARDPLSPWRNLNLGIELYSAGRYAEAETSIRRVLHLAPAFISAHYYLAKALLAQGQAQGALAIAQQEVDEGNRLNILPIVLQAVGRNADADEALHILSTKFADNAAFYVAMVYAYRGDRDEALQWLQRAYRQKDLGLVEIVGEPLLKNLANEPRYKAFLRKMNLPD